MKKSREKNLMRVFQTFRFISAQGQLKLGEFCICLINSIIFFPLFSVSISVYVLFDIYKYMLMSSSPTLSIFYCSVIVWQWCLELPIKSSISKNNLIEKIFVLFFHG